MKFTSKSLADTKKLAGEFLQEINLWNRKREGACVVAMFGELGSGKTTFTSMCADLMGIHERIISPTFILERKYKILRDNFPYENFIHIDAYRLKNSGELEPIYFEEKIKDPKNLIFIEWPEHVLDALPRDCIKIRFEHVSLDSRIIDIDYGREENDQKRNSEALEGDPDGK